MGTPQIMSRDISDLDGICPSDITGVISVGLLIEYDCNMRGHAELSQYKILSLFVTQYILGSRNMILNYTRVIRSMPCVQYRYKGQRGNYIHDRYHGKVLSDHMTFSSLG
ncbi:hypothetical protein QL285_021533 [Trifolium repens]|nr:hypothetical protein QL285_021533 [Trifolium repens]